MLYLFLQFPDYKVTLDLLPILETFGCDSVITAHLHVIHAFNLLLHVKWPDFFFQISSVQSKI